MPQRIEAAFSVDGSTFPAAADIVVDSQSFATSPLIVDLKRKNGRSVQLKLFFADQWIILSETRFISGESHGDFFSPQLREI